MLYALNFERVKISPLLKKSEKFVLLNKSDRFLLFFEVKFIKKGVRFLSYGINLHFVKICHSYSRM